MDSVRNPTVDLGALQTKPPGHASKKKMGKEDSHVTLVNLLDSASPSSDVAKVHIEKRMVQW